MSRSKPRRMRKHRPRSVYTLLDVIAASPTQPMRPERARHQLTRMLGGITALQRDASPTEDDWRMCADAVNLLETLVMHGPWPDADGDLVEVQDASGLLQDAIAAMAQAGRRHLQGHPLRLSGPGLQAVRAVIEDWTTMVGTLPERTIIRCHIATEKRLRQIYAGKGLPHDVEVVAC